MASINKLSIRGVRAFSPEDTEQVVEFYFPCTIIVGMNGCGKTTIVESLKYAITGSLPPGNKSGQAFIHDPRGVGQSTVKASVKLRFTTRSGEAMVVVRSMELSQKKKTVSFKQLDGVLRMQDKETGERLSVSHKCTELDNQIPQLLGISKAILDNVLFCHQEDASWPLMEGAVLKKRFDDIFDSTRYSKALEVFRKTEKDLRDQCKEIKAELAGLASHKHAAEDFRKELQQQLDQEEDLDKEKQEINNEIAAVDKEVDRYEEIATKVENQRATVNVISEKLARLQVAIEKQKEMIEEDFTQTHSLEELNERLADFDRKTSKQKEEEERLLGQVREIESEIESLRRKEMDLKGTLGKYAAEKDAHEKRLVERYSKMEEIQHKYNCMLDLSQTQQSVNESFLGASMASLNHSFDGTGLSQDTDFRNISKEDMEMFNQILQKKEQELQMDLKKHREKANSDIDKISHEVTTYAGKKAALLSDREKLAERKSKLLIELQDVTKQLQTFRHMASRNEIEETKKRAATIAKDLEAANNSERKIQIPVEILSLEKEIDVVKSKIEADKALLGSLRETADKQSAIVLLQEQADRDFETLEESIRDRASDLMRFNLQPKQKLPSGADGDAYATLVSAVDEIAEPILDKFQEVDQSLKSATEKLSEKERILSEKMALLKSSQFSLVSLKSKRDSLGAEDGPVANVRRIVDLIRKDDPSFTGVDEKSPELVVNYLDQKLEDLEQDAPISDAPKLAQRLVKRIKGLMKSRIQSTGEVVCPCCKQQMDDSDLKNFEASMQELFGSDSPLVQSNPEAMGAYQSRKGKLLQWKKTVADCTGSVRDFWRLSEEVATTEAQIQALVQEGAKCQEALNDQKVLVAGFDVEASELQTLVDASRRWADDANRIAAKRDQISSKRASLRSITCGEDRDLRTVEREMSQRMEEKDALSNKINALNKEMTDLNRSISQLSTQFASVEKRARELEAKYAAKKEAEDRKKLLDAQKSELDKEEEKLRRETDKIESKIKPKERERDELRKATSAEEQRLAASVNAFLADVKHLDSLSRQIDEYNSSSKSGDLDRVEKQLSSAAKTIGNRKKDLEDLQPQLESVRNLVKDQERSKNQLRYNIGILNDKMDFESYQKKMGLEEAALQAIEGGDEASAKVEQKMDEKTELLRKKAQIEGRFGEIVERIRQLKRKLTQPEYKDVDKQYKIAMVKKETTEVAAEDLQKYQKALDQALLQFHSVKIAEVNKIIRELWLLTYKGEDITNIEIVSGQESGSKAAKSYNYRVVMTKGTTQLDMRGRCSAGQRVLASIVIRLALAETFGVNCGCIALDEPTVNLDYKNKKGLAVALAQIVASRAQQRNFQLILITHDEEFVSMMKTELSSLTGFSMPEKYFEVSREQSADGRYYSKINAIDWDELE